MRREIGILGMLGLALASDACADAPGGAEVAAVARSPIYQGVREKGEPWVVAVHYQRPGTTKIRLCTGSVIAPRVVLTAKHCVFDEVSDNAWTAVAAKEFTVDVGDDMTSAQGVIRSLGVTEILTPPGDYTQADALAGNDIAVLKLDADAQVEPKPVSVTGPAVGDEVLIAGFGFTENDDLGRKYSGMATVSVVEAGTFETNGPAWTCSGDSGGPALHTGRGEILGVTSLGPAGCSTPRSIYSRVDHHLGLIEQAIGGFDAGPDQGAAGSGVGTDAPVCEDADCVGAAGFSGGQAPGGSAPDSDAEGGCGISHRTGGRTAGWAGLLALPSQVRQHDRYATSSNFARPRLL